MSQMTITEGMAIPDSQAEHLVKIAKEAIDACDTKSDALLYIGDAIKAEEFGNSVPLGDYERKLIFTGFVVGEMLAKMNQHAEMVESKLRELFAGKPRPTDD